jgi:hypothetical protein
VPTGGEGERPKCVIKLKENTKEKIRKIKKRRRFKCEMEFLNIYSAWNCETKRGHVAGWNPILG